MDYNTDGANYYISSNRLLVSQEKRKQKLRDGYASG